MGNRKSGSARFDFIARFLRLEDVSWTLINHHKDYKSSSRLASNCWMAGVFGWEERDEKGICHMTVIFLSRFPSCYDGYLVDPASSHMLVSKIKPCMSKYKQFYGETANGSLNQL